MDQFTIHQINTKMTLGSFYTLCRIELDSLGHRGETLVPNAVPQYFSFKHRNVTVYKRAS